jgi:hypothetical protein
MLGPRLFFIPGPNWQIDMEEILVRWQELLQAWKFKNEIIKD